MSLSAQKHILCLSIGVLSVLLLFGLTAPIADAQQYVPLEPLPSLQPASDTQIGTFVSNLLRVAIGLGAMLAVFLLVLGGIQYMTSDALGGKDAGKTRMQNAIWGLLVLISAVLILYVINPNLLNFNFTVGPVRALPQNLVVPGGLDPDPETALVRAKAYCESQGKAAPVRMSLDQRSYICQ